MSKNGKGKAQKRRTVFLAVRIDPWQDFKIRKIAEAHSLPLNSAISSAINCLVGSIPKKQIERWLREFHSKSGKKNVVD